MNECLPPPPSAAPSRVQVLGKVGLGGCLDRLTAEGYRQRLVYQPADRFWALQWLETALYLLLSGILAALCFWWTRHRLS